MGTVDAGRFDVEILPFLSERIRTILQNKITVDVEEIRLRAGKPLIMQDSQGEWFFNRSGKVRRCAGKVNDCSGTGSDWTGKGRRLDGNASDWACKARRCAGKVNDCSGKVGDCSGKVGDCAGTGSDCDETGARVEVETGVVDNGYVIVEPMDVAQTLELITSNSVYAFQEEIRNGYITIKGGHRVGIAGKIISEGLYVKSIKDIMSLNIRVSKEVKGCADKIFPYLIKGENDLYNTLIVSPPQCGKTTMLRDLIRLLSRGCSVNGFRGIKVCVVDERSEIAACYKGVPQNDVGIRTDILDSCPKIAGMIMGLRALSPVVIATDEIGNEGDKDAITRVLNAGVKILTTAHGYSISELKARKEVMELIEEKVFERYVVLSSREGPGTVEEIIEGENFKNII